MNDLKIIRYELKRLIFSKYYVFLLLITGLFAYYILSQKVILGTAYTAPFSNWSYTTFLCDMLPYFLVILLFFCTYVVSRKELRVRTLTLSTPLAVTRYYLFKAVAILSSVFFTVFLIIGLSFGFYALVFDYSCFAGFFTPIILFVIPPLFFVFGLGMLLGSLNEIFLYILIPLMFLFGNLSFPLPIWLDLFRTGYPADLSLFPSNRSRWGYTLHVASRFLAEQGSVGVLRVGFVWSDVFFGKQKNSIKEW